MKDFVEDFKKLFLKLKSGENYSFTRFSDGEMFVMQKKRLVLANKHVQVGEKIMNFGYGSEDHKDFDPTIHSYVSDKLLQSFIHKQKNYYVGISCPCCVPKQDSGWMKNLRENDEEETTWANLFVNANYPLFLKYFYPEFKNKKCVIVCNENANIDNLPFDIVKDFRIGSNAIVNDFGLEKRVNDWILANNIKDHVFLLAATSISNLIAYECFPNNPVNTFLDIGTTLNKFIDTDIARDYLKKFWIQRVRNPKFYKRCIWN